MWDFALGYACDLCYEREHGYDFIVPKNLKRRYQRSYEGCCRISVFTCVSSRHMSPMLRYALRKERKQSNRLYLWYAQLHRGLYRMRMALIGDSGRQHHRELKPVNRKPK